MNKLLLSLLLGVGLMAQTPPYYMQLSQQPLPAVDGNQVNAVYTGARGATTLYYIVIARYGVGNASPSVPVATFNTSSSGLVILNWNAPASPQGYTLAYDVIRLTSPSFPASGTCLNCLVASATTSVSVTDTLANNLNSYILASYNTNQPYTLSLDNVNASSVLLSGIVNGIQVIHDAINIGSSAGGPVWQLRVKPSTSALLATPLTPNTSGLFTIAPSVGGVGASSTVSNTIDENNRGQIQINVNATNANFIVNNNGTPANVITALNFNMHANVAVINWQWSNVTKSQINPDGSHGYTGVSLTSLGTPANGTLQYCTDCLNASNPCSGSSTGAMAKRLNGAWDCR